MMKTAGLLRLSGIFDCETAAHTKMHDQHLAGRKVGEEIFGAPAEAFNALPFKTRAEFRREGKAQIGAIDVEPADFVPHKRRLQTAAYGLNFGEFGHGLSSFAWHSVLTRPALWS